MVEENQKICTQCGASLSAHSRFCSQCGFQLSIQAPKTQSQVQVKRISQSSPLSTTDDQQGIDLVEPRKGNSILDSIQYYSDKAGSAAGTADVLGSLNNIGVDRLNEGKNAEAITFFDRVLMVDPTYVKAWINKANALSVMGKPAASIACVDKALAIDPNNEVAWSNRAGDLITLKRFEDALDNCEKALQINTKYASAWVNQGNAQTYLGYSADALESYNTSIRLDPSCRVAYENKAYLLESLGRPDDAKKTRNDAGSYIKDNNPSFLNGAGALVREWIAPKPITLTEDTNYYHRMLTWEHKNDVWSCEILIPKELFQYYRNIPRETKHEHNPRYVLSQSDIQVLQPLMHILNEEAKKRRYSQIDIVKNIIKSVQSLPYRTDIETMGVVEYARYPIETLVDGGGDCECTAILAAKLLYLTGHDVAFINYPTHLAVGIAGVHGSEGTYFEFENKKYFFIDTTSPGWNIGKIPQQYRDMNAIIYPIR